MTNLLIDSSVVIKWFHDADETHVAEARAIRDAHVRGDLEAHIIDLGVYEIGNVLSRALRWSAADVADQLDDLLTIVGPPIAMARSWFTEAASLAGRHGLSFYDASWAAAAAGMRTTLVSADRRLLESGLAESPTDAAHRLRLLPRD